VPPVNAVQSAGVEERLAGGVRLGRGADRLEPVENLAPQRAHSLGIGRHEPELGAARERLPYPHARHDAEGLGRRRDLADQLRPARLGRERGRLGEHRVPVPQRCDEGETGDQDAYDH
jgi:hypothetical protein